MYRQFYPAMFFLLISVLFAAPLAAAPIDPATSYEWTVLKDNARFYWSFNETGAANAVDLVRGQANDEMVATNGATRTTGNTAAMGNTTLLDGENDFFLASAMNDFEMAGPWALECWMKADGTVAGTRADYLINPPGGYTNNPAVIYDFNDTRVELYSGAGRTGTGGPAVNDNNWHHIVATFYGNAGGYGVANRVDMAIDGVLIDHIPTTFSAGFALSGMIVGAATTTGANAFQGQLDEVAFYDLSGLTEAQVAARTMQIAAHSSAAAQPAAIPLAYVKGVTYTYSTAPGAGNYADPSMVKLTDGTIGSSTYQVGYNDNTWVGWNVSSEPNSLVSYWSFDGTTKDQAVNKNDAVIYNGAAYSADIPGVLAPGGQSMQFDGVNDYLQVADSASLDSISGSGVASSVAFWFQTNESGNKVVLEKGANQLFVVQTETTPYEGKISYRMQGDNTNRVISTQPVNDGQWHHFAATYNGTEIEMFIDGVSQGIHADASSAANDDPLTIGSRLGAFGVPGRMDDLALWKGVLTPEQITKMVAEGYAPDELATDVVITFDLQAVKTLDTMMLDYVVNHAAGIRAPDGVIVTTSVDGVNFDPLPAEAGVSIDFNDYDKFNPAVPTTYFTWNRRFQMDLAGAEAQYVKIEVLNGKTIPHAGNVPAWTFLGEAQFVEIVPEPSTWLLMFSALVGLGLLARRRRV